MKAMTKSELADAAGVSSRTFTRWLKAHRQQLAAMGVGEKTQLLPPKAVIYICDTFCTDVG